MFHKPYHLFHFFSPLFIYFLFYTKSLKQYSESFPYFYDNCHKKEKISSIAVSFMLWWIKKEILFMEKLYDKLILFLCSTIFLISHEFSPYTVLPIIIVICLSSFISFFNKASLNILTYVCYVGLCIYSPNFIFFPFMI